MLSGEILVLKLGPVQEDNKTPAGRENGCKNIRV